MKSKRTLATGIKQGVRHYVLDRDGHKCVHCGFPYNLTMAHVFINRSHGGKGIKENLATLCIQCHMKLDHGKEKDAQPIRNHVEHYMKRLYGEPKLDELKYKKE